MGKIEKLINSLRNKTGKEVKGMKKVLISLGLAMVLVMAMTAPAMALEGSESAAVTVTEYISFTVGDTGGTSGVDFGSLDPGALDTKDENQEADWTSDPVGQISGAVILTVGTETNKATTVSLCGTDFSGAGTIAISNVKYDDDNKLGEGGSETDEAEGTMSTYTTYTSWYTVNAFTGDTTHAYHWITIPSVQAQGGYTSTFYYKCE